MKEEYFKWYSPTLSKEVEMLVYGHAGYPVIIFPSTKGRYYESRDFKLIDSAAWFLDQGLIQLYCVDSIDALSWYNRGIHPADRIKNHLWFDQFIMNEIVDPIRREKSIPKVAVSGASFGGFHAANFAFRHPESVSHLFSMSGAFDTKSFLDGYYDDNAYFTNPVDFLPGNNHPELWNMKIVLGVGEWDICLDANNQMSNILKSKTIDHWFDLRKWAEHDWPLWRAMFPHYLSLI